MNSYCRYNEEFANKYEGVFSNKENEELDKLARKINNDRKKPNAKNTMLDKSLELYSGMESLMDPANVKFAPSSLLPNFSFFSTQGDFSSQLPTPMKKVRINDSYDDRSMTTIASGSDNTFGSKIVTPEESISDFESDISSNYSSLKPTLKKHLKMSNNHLKTYHENDEVTILNHINKCIECKKQLLTLLNNGNTPQNTSILNLSTVEIKDILIMILIGVFIIILIDFFFRR